MISAGHDPQDRDLSGLRIPKLGREAYSLRREQERHHANGGEGDDDQADDCLPAASSPLPVARVQDEGGHEGVLQELLHNMVGLSTSPTAAPKASAPRPCQSATPSGASPPPPGFAAICPKTMAPGLCHSLPRALLGRFHASSGLQDRSPLAFPAGARPRRTPGRELREGALPNIEVALDRARAASPGDGAARRLINRSGRLPGCVTGGTSTPVTPSSASGMARRVLTPEARMPSPIRTFGSPSRSPPGSPRRKSEDRPSVNRDQLIRITSPRKAVLPATPCSAARRSNRSRSGPSPAMIS